MYMYKEKTKQNPYIHLGPTQGRKKHFMMHKIFKLTSFKKKQQRIKDK